MSGITVERRERGSCSRPGDEVESCAGFTETVPELPSCLG
jgi:hypothetical protein